MKNSVQPGDHLTVTAPAAVASGGAVLLGALFGVAVHEAASGESVTIDLRGVYDLPKATGSAWTVGERIYWDATAGAATDVATNNTEIGKATAAAISAAIVGRVRLNG